MHVKSYRIMLLWFIHLNNKKQVAVDTGHWTSLDKCKEALFVSVTAHGASHYAPRFCWRSIYILQCTVGTLLVHKEESSLCITR